MEDELFAANLHPLCRDHEEFMYQWSCYYRNSLCKSYASQLLSSLKARDEVEYLWHHSSFRINEILAVMDVAHDGTF